MIRPPVRFAGLGLSLLVCAIAGSGCRENPVAYREVPRESPAAATMPTPPHGPMGGAVASAPVGPVLEWTPPEAWETKPASEMRLATYAFTAADGSLADVSVFSFPDAAGGLVANVNRWRAQVGLEAVAPDAIETSATPTTIAGLEAWLVDFAGTPTSSAPMMGSTPPPTGLTRITGAIVPLGGKSWFFKVMGPDAVVVSQHENFQQFVASIRVGAAATASGPVPAAAAAAVAANRDPHAGIPGAPPLGGAAAGDPHAGIPGAPALGSGVMDPSAIPGPVGPPIGFTFETPVGWEAQPSSQFRLASFKIPGSGVPPADVSVTNFPGTVGGDFANINRWRGQLGLPPLSEAEFASSVTRVIGYHDQEFVVTEMESTGPVLEGGLRARMIAGIFKQADSTWFFKMTGETAHVASQREAFTRFLQSFHLEDGHTH